jgi:hypothetical protein
MVELKIGTADQGMDWLQWSSSIVSSLAWPVAAVVIACIFRSQIAGLLAKLRKLSWGDKVLDFADKLDRIETVSQTTTPADNEQEYPAPLPDMRFQQLLAISPSAAILDAWKPIELRLRDLSSHYDSGIGLQPRALTTRRVMEQLYKSGAISSGVYEMLRDLQGLRNAAAHQDEVTSTDAIRFQAFADKVMRALEKA